MMKNLTVTVDDARGKRWTRITDANSPTMFSNRFRSADSDRILSYDNLVAEHGPLTSAVSGQVVTLVGDDLIEAMS